jgi:hypothetical protein
MPSTSELLGKPRTLFVLVACLALMTWTAVRISALDRSVYSERVYTSFRASGTQANAGRNPYAVTAETWHFGWRLPHSTARVHFVDPNLSPPAMIPLFQWGARHNAMRARHALTAASGAIFAGCTLLLFFALDGNVQKRQIIFLLFSMPVLNTLFLAQDYALLMLLGTLIWVMERKGNWVLAAVAIGLLTVIKPNLATWPAILLIAGYRGRRRMLRQGFWAFATLAVLCALAAWRYNPHVYWQWLHASRVTDHSIFATDISLAGFFGRTFGIRGVGGILAIIGLLGTAWLAWNKNLDDRQLAILGVSSGMLCAPLAWAHYTLVLYPWLVDKKWRLRETCAGILLMIPIDWTWMGSKFGGNDAMLAVSSLVYLEAIVLILWCGLDPDWPSNKSAGRVSSLELA